MEAVHLMTSLARSEAQGSWGLIALLEQSASWGILNQPVVLSIQKDGLEQFR